MIGEACPRRKAYRARMTTRDHDYAARVVWTDARGAGTADYASYARRHTVLVAGKPPLAATADPAFRGEADAHNPEELFLAAIAGCHLLTYLALCARRGVRVVGYEDDAAATLRLEADGRGALARIVLRPRVTVARAADAAPAAALHAAAHAACFLARSCAVPIVVEPTVRVA